MVPFFSSYVEQNVSQNLQISKHMIHDLRNILYTCLPFFVFKKIIIKYKKKYLFLFTDKFSFSPEVTFHVLISVKIKLK